MSKSKAVPFEFTVDDLKRLEQVSESNISAIDAFIADRYKAIGAHLRLHLVKPFCQKYNLRFDSGMGSRSFYYNLAGADFGKVWYVGEGQRRLPGRPDNDDSDEWFTVITPEEKAIRLALNIADYRGNTIGTWVNNYPDKNGL